MRARHAGWIALVLVGCVEPDEAVEEEGTPPDGVLALAPDPALVVAGGWCYGNYVWNGTSARVYWPSNGGCGSTVESPLVVMLNGYDFSHTDYDYLLRHLAKNGYIGVSIDAIPNGVTENAYEDAAEKAWDFVIDFMWNSWSKGSFIDRDNVALIGHSRGGETVEFLAESLAADPNWHVRAVVSLAPTQHHSVVLDAGNTDAAMVLVGSMDEDNTPARAYDVYDRASSEASQLDPGVNPAVIYKSMKLLHGVVHADFAQDELAQDPAVWDVTKGYALAFLHAHLKGDWTYYPDYVQGEAVPFGWPDGVTTQYSDGLLRRVIDNFEDGTTANSTIGGFVSVGFGVAGGALDLGVSTFSPHDTWVLRFNPPASGAGFIWSLPAGKRDQGLYTYLSARVGQIAGVATDDLRVRIQNSGVNSPWVRFTDHGTLAQHMDMCVTPNLCNEDDQRHLGTIRIPLTAFGAHNNVTQVEIGATSEATDGEFYIDSLEFSEWDVGL